MNTHTANIRSGANRIPVAAYRTFRWTPVSCVAPSAVTITPNTTTGNGATVTWTAPSTPPANGYEYYFTTTAGTPPANPTVPTAPIDAPTTSATITTMNGNTTYYVWVRSDCGGSFSAWTLANTTVTTLCSGVTGDYLNYFEEFSSVDPIYNYTAPAIQPCHSIQNAGTANNWYSTNVASPVDGFPDEHMEYSAHPSIAANAWFYTRGVQLTAGTTYQLSYYYGGSTNFSFLTNKLKVAYGTSPFNTSMTTVLDDHPNIKHTGQMNFVNFFVPTTGVYYFGFQAYSAANMGKIFLDDIQIVEGICKQPSGVATTAVSATSATLTWTAPTPAPAGGYAYYLATSATPPVNGTTPTGTTSAGTTVVTLNGLNGNTNYCFWVRGNCNGGDYSAWSVAYCFTTPVLPPYCFPTSTLGTAYISNVTTTNAVQNINNSSAWTSPGFADYTAFSVIESQGGNLNFSIGLDDGDATPGIAGGVGVAIWVDWDNDGTFTTAERMFNTAAYIGTSPVTGAFTVPAGAPLGTKRMRVMADYWATSPSPCAYGGTTTRGELEDYSFKVVVPPPALTLSTSTTTQCASTNSPLVTITAGLSDYNTFTWSPAGGVTGTAASGYTFNTGSTVTYTLTATQTSGAFSVNTAQYTYVANALPTPITITTTPTGGTVCQTGPALQLTASGGVVSGLPILSENFNSGAPTWTTVNTSTGGNTAGPTWTIHPDGFDATGPSWGTTIFHSNDASSFMFSDSDLQGSGTNTNVELISPAFSLAGFTSASLSFWHFYRPWTPSTATVEISTNGGGAYVQLPGLVYTTVAQGTPTNFNQVVFDLGPYLGQTNIKIRFKWVASWGWGWAIDNFLVSGSATSAITWAPTTGLYTNAAATVAYTGGGTNVVYALPSATQTYTASASTPSPVCSTNTTQTVTVTPIVAGTISADQNLCSGTAAAIVLTGQSGTITTWQSSADSAFTTPTNIAGSAGATTLTPAMIGAVNATTYIRAQITNGTCTTYTNYVTLTVTTATWNGATWTNGPPTAGKRLVFSGNYASSADVQGCSVLVTAGSVTFNPGHSLIVQNGVSVTGGSLTFENNASLVQVNDAAVNTGAITYKRITTPMSTYDYTYWSSPLASPQTLFGLSPLTRFDKYHEWNVNTNAFVTIMNGAAVMTAGKGYIMRAPAGWSAVPTACPLFFNMGPANNGVINMAVAPSGLSNLNLLGNPYPSALDANLFLSNPANTELGGTLYFWTHNAPISSQVYSNSNYASYNLLGGTAAVASGSANTNAPTKNIAAGNGFFATIASAGSITYNNGMRLAGFNDNFYRPASADLDFSKTVAPVELELERNRIWLNITNAGGAFSQSLVGYVTNGTYGMDRDFDGAVLGSSNPVYLYSIVETNKLAIQGRALPFDNNDQVPLGYKANNAGEYTITMPDFDGLFLNENQDIYLKDLVLDVTHDLKAGPYTFTTTAGEFQNRFVIVYNNQQLSAPVFNENSVVVYKNNGTIYINTGNMTMEDVKIFDTRGRLILEKKGVQSTETQISNLGAAEQVLIIQVTSVDNVTVSKKIVY
ncbi:GEVED domain-containing protein [Flavobacterium sp.]|uniref:GEVED domain-containing protein n=1 Tax=Flavobacterium sp. TaxID=239 RepID=UPI0025BD6C0B|nr:GEVED domain-containing protein [Flavobacterium sp.]